MRSKPPGADVPHAYMIHAARKTEKQRVGCASAALAVQQRDHLLRNGWGVSIADHSGIPIANIRMDARAKAEALIEHAQAVRLKVKSEPETAN